MFRIFSLLSLLIIITNCTPTSGAAFLGPIFTGATSGSIYQASISYGSGQFMNNLKKEYEEKKQKLKKKSVEMINIIDDKFKIPPVLLSLNVENIETSEIIEPEPLP